MEKHDSSHIPRPHIVREPIDDSDRDRDIEDHRQRIERIESHFDHGGRVWDLERWRQRQVGMATAYVSVGALLIWVFQKIWEIKVK